MVNYNQSLDLKYSVSKIHTAMKASCSALTSEVTVRDTFTLKVRPFCILHVCLDGMCIWRAHVLGWHVCVHCCP